VSSWRQSPVIRQLALPASAIASKKLSAAVFICVFVCGSLSGGMMDLNFPTFPLGRTRLPPGPKHASAASLNFTSDRRDAKAC
jgi:hypothetical protein